MIDIIVVNDYISQNVLHSQAWDTADDATRTKAVNNGERILKRVLPTYYPDTLEIPTEDIALQALWLLRLDDTIQRAEQGVTSVSVEGFAVSVADRDRSVAPIILKTLGINPNDPTALVKRRVGSYSVSVTDTNRIGVFNTGGYRR